MRKWEFGGRAWYPETEMQKEETAKDPGRDRAHLDNPLRLERVRRHIRGSHIIQQHEHGIKVGETTDFKENSLGELFISGYLTDQGMENYKKGMRMLSVGYWPDEISEEKPLTFSQCYRGKFPGTSIEVQCAEDVTAGQGSGAGKKNIPRIIATIPELTMQTEQPPTTTTPPPTEQKTDATTPPKTEQPKPEEDTPMFDSAAIAKRRVAERSAKLTPEEKMKEWEQMQDALEKKQIEETMDRAVKYHAAFKEHGMDDIDEDDLSVITNKQSTKFLKMFDTMHAKLASTPSSKAEQTQSQTDKTPPPQQQESGKKRKADSQPETTTVSFEATKKTATPQKVAGNLETVSGKTDSMQYLLNELRMSGKLPKGHIEKLAQTSVGRPPENKQQPVEIQASDDPRPMINRLVMSAELNYKATTEGLRKANEDFKRTASDWKSRIRSVTDQ